MPITRVLTDSLTHSNAKCENQSLVFHPMTHWITLQCLFNFTKSRVFPWVANFQGLTVGFACLPTLSRTYIVGRIGLIENKILVFHPEGGLPHLTSPKHTKFIIIILCIRNLYLLLLYTTVSLDFGRCPISELTIHSPRIMNNSTMHPHPTRCHVTVHMKCNHVISCYTMLHAQ